MNALAVSLRRDLRLAARRPAEVATSLVFFVVVVSLFPLGIGPEMALLQRVAPGVIWVAALLATLLGLPRLFAADHADGTLEQLMLSPQSQLLLVAGKVLAHWLLCGLPLVLLAPLLGLQFNLSGEVLLVLVLALLLGTPVLSLVGAIGAALTLGVRGGGALLALLMLPLFVPTLVFGSGAVEASAAGLGAGPQLSLLGALLIVTLLFAPWAATAALRIALD
ncbi:heme exporter protein CcmB [Roseateles sp. BYS96W]|uniref:Heme exporter protein B n=1 Tax=Pelomonas nitida TaxID=3299027 RepID=A0ABW7GC49_9BURK